MQRRINALTGRTRETIDARTTQFKIENTVWKYINVRCPRLDTERISTANTTHDHRLLLRTLSRRGPIEFAPSIHLFLLHYLRLLCHLTCNHAIPLIIPDGCSSTYQLLDPVLCRASHSGSSDVPSLLDVAFQMTFSLSHPRWRLRSTQYSRCHVPIGCCVSSSILFIIKKAGVFLLTPLRLSRPEFRLKLEFMVSQATIFGLLLILIAELTSQFYFLLQK